MRTRVFGTLMIAFFSIVASNSFAQEPQSGTSQASAAQSRIVGVVEVVDKSKNQVTIKSDAGESVTIVTNETSAVLRMPAGETSAQKALKITLADIAVGDRLFARGTISSNGKSVEARQVVVTSNSTTVSAAATQEPQRQGEEFRRRGLVGRITAVDSGKKEITLQSRSREGTGPIKVVASDATRFFRYAPDSLNIKDASRSSFADLKVGDQLRALGDRSEDGTRFTAEEVIAGLITRTGGQVIAVRPEASELTIKSNQTGETITVKVGSRSALRRVTAEVAASFEANRPARPNRSPEAGQQERPRERRERGSRTGGAERRPWSGRGFQDTLEKLPPITVNDVKKGDTVFVSGSQGADPNRLTAIMLVTGDPAFMNRLMQTGPGRGPQNPGLPGDVLGGGAGGSERPTSP